MGLNLKNRCMVSGALLNYAPFSNREAELQDYSSVG